MPHVVGLVEVRADERQVVVGGQGRDGGRVESVGAHVIREGASERAVRQLRQRADVDRQPALLADGLGSHGVAGEVIAQLGDDLYFLSHQTVGNLEHASEMVGVTYQVDEAPKA